MGKKSDKYHGNEAKEFAKKRNIEIVQVCFYVAVLVVVAILGCAVDYAIFMPILNYANHEADITANLILTIAFSVIPIIWACIMSPILRKTLNKEKRHTSHIVWAAVLSILFVVYVLGSSMVRSQRFSSNNDFAALMNIAPVVIAFLVLSLHMLIEHVIEIHYDKARVFGSECNYHSKKECLARYESISGVDKKRRESDFRCLIDVGESLIKRTLEALKSSRRILSKKAANSAADADAIMRTPFRIGNRDITDDAEAKEAIRDAIDAYRLGDQLKVMGAPINGPHMDDEVKDAIKAFEAHHDEIVTRYAGALA